jgi:hypothetical protein
MKAGAGPREPAPEEATVEYRYDSAERHELVRLTHIATNYTYDHYDQEAADEADVPLVVDATPAEAGTETASLSRSGSGALSKSWASGAA